jgi:AraC family transcriptional regulator
MNNLQHPYYISCINSAIDYIEGNIDKPLRLENIARAASLSPFHFHRIFKSYMNESLNNFVRRVRVEKAALMLFTNPGYSITEVAYLNGFSSSQALAKQFRLFFGATPGQYRKSKIGHRDSKKSQDYTMNFHYPSSSKQQIVYYNSERRNVMKVEIKKIPDTTLAYIRHIGPYKGNSELFGKLFNKLCTWAGPKHLITKDTNYYCIYYDGPDVTDESKLRTDACINVPEDTKVSGEIGKQLIKGGDYAVLRCIIKDPKEYGKYWDELYTSWLPSSGYQPDNKPPFEMYPADCRQQDGSMIVDICMPVKPA